MAHNPLAKTLATKDNKQIERYAPANVELTGLARRVANATAAYNLTGSGLAALGNFVFPTGIDYGGNGFLGAMFGTTAGGALGSFLSVAPRDFDYSQVDPTQSSVTMACLNWIARTGKEAKPEVYKPGKNGVMEIVLNHPATRLLRRPNRFYTYSKMIGATLVDYNINGMAYWFKQKGEEGVGLTKELYYVPSIQLQPARLPNSNNYIDYYRYYVNGRVYAVPPERLICFRWELDITNPMFGRKPLAPVMSEIFGDEQAAKYTAALLRNMAIPGVAIIPLDDTVEINDEDAEAMKESFKRKFGGDNVGEPWISNFKADIKTLGFDPRHLTLKDLRRIPEERVSAVLGVPAIVAGLGAGLDRSTYSNFEQAVSHGVESNLVPTWTDLGEELTRQLLGEFEKDTAAEIRYNTANVKALQENADALYKRYNSIWVTNLITRAEARAKLGLEVEEARDNIFYSELKAALAPQTQTGQPPDNGGGEDGGEGKRAGGKKSLRVKRAQRQSLDRAFTMLLDSTLREAIPGAEKELSGFFQDLGEAAEELAEEGVDLDSPELEGQRIGDKAIEAVVDGLAALFINMGASVKDATILAVSLTLGITPAQSWHNYSTNRFNSLVETRQVSYAEELKAQTRQAVAEAIRLSKAGVPAGEIPDRIKGYVEGRGMYPGVFQGAYDKAIGEGKSAPAATIAGEEAARDYRAKLIAETEVRTLQNGAALESMQAAGVESVYVRDGDGCGWTLHDDPDKADKTTRALVEAKRYPLAHPNCKRQFYPPEA